MVIWIRGSVGPVTHRPFFSPIIVPFSMATSPLENPLIAAQMSTFAEFCNTNQERHALFVGVTVGFRGGPFPQFFNPEIPADVTGEALADVKSEYHYYLLGYVIGYFGGRWLLPIALGYVIGNQDLGVI